MAYTDIDFKTKKLLKQAVDNGESVYVYQAGSFPLSPRSDGSVSLEGPHYPKPHTWYATAKVDENFKIVKGSVK